MTFLHLRERLSGGCWTMKAYSFRALGATVILAEHWLQHWKKKKEGVCVLLFCFLQPGMKNGVRRCVLGKDPKRELETRQPRWVITHMLISIIVPYKVLAFQIKPSLLLKYLHKSKTNSMECCMHSPLFQLCFIPWTVTPVCLRLGWARLKNAVIWWWMKGAARVVRTRMLLLLLVAQSSKHQRLLLRADISPTQETVWSLTVASACFAFFLFYFFKDLRIT